MEVSPQAEETLIDILCRQDALFAHRREYLSGRPLPPRGNAAIGERRAAFWRGEGVPFTFRGDAAARKAGERFVDELVQLGLVATNSVAIRRRGARLTDFGGAVARRLAGCFTLRDAWPVLFRLAETIAQRGVLIHGRPSVRETTLADTDYGRTGWRDAVMRDEYKLLSLKAAGFATDLSDDSGRVWLELRDAGRAALAGPIPEEPADLPRMSDHLADQYTSGLIEACHDRRNWKPSVPFEIFVPAPVCPLVTR